MRLRPKRPTLPAGDASPYNPDPAGCAGHHTAATGGGASGPSDTAATACQYQSQRMITSGRGSAPPHFFDYRGDILHAEAVSLDSLAQCFGTPLYVYSTRAITEAWQRFTQPLAGTTHQVCYAVKANSNLAILELLGKLGAGFDIVSSGELERVLRASGPTPYMVFSGVGKRTDELLRALLAGVQCINVESEAELMRLSALATLHGKTAAIALRINPDVATRTHPHISTGNGDAKFGIDPLCAAGLYQQAAALPGIRITGIACHIGSQLADEAPFLEAAQHLMALVDRLRQRGINLEQVDFGGGFGIDYHGGCSLDIGALICKLRALSERRGLRLILEPGRAIVAMAGVLLTRVEYLKNTEHGRFIIVDAGMTELIRPPLYDAWHDIRPVALHVGMETQPADVVGPVCESADFLGRDRRIAVLPGELLAVMDAGAYGSSMGSNYNSRPRAAEVLIDGEHVTLIRRRETLEQTMSNEGPLP